MTTTTDGVVASAPTGEGRMLPSLITFLERTSRIREDSFVIEEMPWRGRRIDLVTLTNTGIASAFELKIGSFGRVLEQAIYNGLSFDRSWMVLPARPRIDNQRLASHHNVGIIVAEPMVRVLLRAPLAKVDPGVRGIVRIKILTTSEVKSRDV